MENGQPFDWDHLEFLTWGCPKSMTIGLINDHWVWGIDMPHWMRIWNLTKGFYYCCCLFVCVFVFVFVFRWFVLFCFGLVCCVCFCFWFFWGGFNCLFLFITIKSNSNVLYNLLKAFVEPLIICHTNRILPPCDSSSWPCQICQTKG